MATAASPILSIFESHLEDRTAGGDDLTLTEAFRKIFGKSKVRPCSPVRQALEQSDEDLSNAIRQDFEQSSLLSQLSFDSDSTTCVSSIKSIAVVLLYLQLLMERKVPGNTLTPQQCTKMAMSLLQNLVKAVSNLPPSALPNDDDLVICNDKQNPAMVRQFTLCALVRIIDPYCSGAPFLLSALWKGISDIIASSTTLPYELTKELCRALLKYIQEGEEQVGIIMSTNQQQQQLFYGKMFAFLLTRLSTLFPLYLNAASGEDDENVDSEHIQEIWTLLIRLHGLGVRQQTQNPYTSLVVPKIDLCVFKALTSAKDDNGAAIVDKDKFFALLRARNDSGKATLLLNFLKKANTDPKMVMTVAEYWLFEVAPKCPSARLIDSDEAVAVFAKATLSFEVDGNNSSGSIRHLLLKWLATPTTVHPVTQTVLIRLVCAHCVGLSRMGTLEQTQGSHDSDSPRSVLATPSNHKCVEPFIHMMCQILFDSRTITQHRKNVSSVLVRLLMDTSTGSGETLRSTARSCLLTNALQFARKCSSLATKKRKRKDSNKITIVMEDAVCIHQTMSACGGDSIKNESVRETLSLLHSDLKGQEPKSPLFFIKGRQPVEIAVLLGILTGIVRDGRQINDGFEKAVGCSLREFVPKMSGWFLAQCQRRQQSKTIRRSTAILLHAILGLVQSTLSLYKKQSSQDNVLAPLVNTSIQLVVLACNHSRKLVSDDPKSLCNGTHLWLSFASTIGELFLLPTSPPKMLQQLCSSIKSALKQKQQHWPLYAVLVHNLARFAQAIPSTHQGMIKKHWFPTKESKQFFRCRIAKSVYRHEGESNNVSVTFLFTSRCCAPRVN